MYVSTYVSRKEMFIYHPPLKHYPSVPPHIRLVREVRGYVAAKGVCTYQNIQQKIMYIYVREQCQGNAGDYMQTTLQRVHTYVRMYKLCHACSLI